MENIFLIKWYGPFASLKDVKQWENEQTFKCSLYLLHGKEKYAKTSEKYYCGMSIRSVNKRLCDKGHHIEEIQARLISIYVGCLAHTDNPSREQVKLAEKVITANLTYFAGADNVLNAINTYFPCKNVYVINEWWKKDGMSIWQRQPKNSPSNIIPDVIVWHYNCNGGNDLLGCKKSKSLVK